MGIDDTILSLQPGDRLGGRYELVRILGRGGMGVVWLAHDHRLDGRPVALKVLPAALSTDARAVARLKAEAARNLDLTHPNIVRLHTFDQDPTRQDVAFLVMQYIEGQTLNDSLAEHPDGLPIATVRPWFEQVAQAIDYAHERGILHRDIKPGNIIIETKTNTAYLMDFGIGREARDTMTRVTGVQDSSGTLPYMSPQQLMGKNEASNDIYSFAATLYEALCGHPPFHTGDIGYQIRHAEPEAIARADRAINDALRRGLAKDASGRPTTCWGLLAGQGAAAKPATSRASLAATVPSRLGPRHLDRKTVEFAPGVTGEFVFIDAPGVAPNGFLMGSPPDEADRNSDETQHRVRLTCGYWIQTTSATQGQWSALMGFNPSRYRIGANHPIENVGWDDCQVFIAKVCERGVTARLPTEAEWEFACRAGTTTPFNTGVEIRTDQANFDGRYFDKRGRQVGECRGKTTPVASYLPNTWCLFDMHGNVWEWCNDYYGEYPTGTSTDPVGPQVGALRVLRGGSCDTKSSSIRSARRINYLPKSPEGYGNAGFRLCLDPE